MEASISSPAVPEILIRLGCFLGVLVAMAAWESWAPRRRLTLPKRWRWPSNLLLVALNAALARLAIPLTSAGAALWAESRGWGLLAWMDLPAWLEFVAAIVALDFAIYLQHVTFHAVPLLWRLHMVHHADLDIDVTTGLRFHTFEILLSALFRLAVVFLLGPAAIAVLTFEVLLNATAMFNHSNIRIPLRLDRLLRRVIVTPDMHRVHHSVIKRETNSNYGFNLPWWDFVLGTYCAQPAAGHERMTIGLEQYRSRRVAWLPWILLLPFIKAAALALVLCGLTLLSATLIGLADEAPPQRKPRLAALPASAPQPPDNPTTPAKVELGKQLFFDPRLSGDNRMSCATCHLPDKAFGDGLPRGRGAAGKTLARNTQTLLNTGFYASLFWDGRAASLEQQALGPIQSPDEMNQDLDELVKELSGVPGYAEQFRKVFGQPVTEQGIAKALAAFQRTLISRNSPFDRYLGGDKHAISARAQAGLELFTSDAGCIRCHHGPLLSDNNYYRLGVGGGDKGRAAVTNQRRDLYKFRTPSLRDVARTGPYMHDGSQATLFEVVQFYFRGAPTRGPDGLELDIEPLLGQSFSDIDAIVEFLKSLSGEPPQITPPDLP